MSLEKIREGLPIEPPIPIGELPSRAEDLAKKLREEGREEDARLTLELHRVAIHDRKTGALNELGFEIAIQEALKGQPPKISEDASYFGQERRDSEVDWSKGCLMVFDLDEFKQKNDTLGHIGGDKALQAVVDHWRNHIREYDIFARIGGDEFVVLFRGASATEIKDKYKSVTKFTAEIEGVQTRITLSGGLVDIDPNIGETYDDLKRKADSALYRAKEQGRACTVVY